MFFALRDGRPVLPGDQAGTDAAGAPLIFVSAGQDYIHVRVDGAARPGIEPAILGMRIVGPDGFTFPALAEGESLPPVCHPDGSADARWRVSREFTGDPDRRQVARFCADEWIGSATTVAGAWVLAYYHAARHHYALLSHPLD